MNKKEYISALRAQLRRLPSDDVEEIVKEFETHFDIGLSEGKNESEIAAKLGSPEEVAQIYLSDSVPAFDMSGAGNVCNPDFPIIPVKTGMVIDRGIGPQTAAGFAAGGYAKPLVNQAPRNRAPKPEPDGENAHTGAKEREVYEEVGPQGKKQYELPDYSSYPTQDPNAVPKPAKSHNLLFAILFTIFVFVPVWIIGLALLLLLIALPIGLGYAAYTLFTWAPTLSVGVAGTVCLGISLVFGAITALFIAFFALKGFILGTISYIRYIFNINSKSAKGGNA